MSRGPRLLLFDLATLKTRWLRSHAVRSFELGRIAPSEFATAFMTEWDIAGSPQAFLDEFTSWPTGLYSGAAGLLARLRSRHRTACLGNSNVLHWRRFGGFAELFDVALSSHLLGVIKPDAECFEKALRVLGAAAAYVVFFDDSPLNVDAAGELGLNAHHVDGFAALQQVLEMEGLLS